MRLNCLATNFKVDQNFSTAKGGGGGLYEISLEIDFIVVSDRGE